MQVVPSVGFCKAISMAFNNIGNSRGRSRRSEFWYFFLFCWCVMISILGIIVLLASIPQYSNGVNVVSLFFTFYIVWIVIFSTFLSLTSRRLHDIGKSNVLMLVMFIPLGILVLLYFCCIDSQQTDNDYGPSPKYVFPLNDPLNPNDDNNEENENPLSEPNLLTPQINN